MICIGFHIKVARPSEITLFVYSTRHNKARKQTEQNE